MDGAQQPVALTMSLDYVFDSPNKVQVNGSTLHPDGRYQSISTETKPQGKSGSPPISVSISAVTTSSAFDASDTRQATPTTVSSSSRGGRASSVNPPPAQEVGDSKWAVPFDYRGPIPKADDPEDVLPLPKISGLPEHVGLGVPAALPTNRQGWRYDGAAPASDHLPESVYKTIEVAPRGVHWSWQDRSSATYLNQDASVITTDKGWRSARSNIGVREGCWYAEVEILEPIDLGPLKMATPGSNTNPMTDGSHVRIGWGRREGSLNAPVGSDGYSYGIRDTGGERVHIARPISYGRPFKAGDTVGLFIKLPHVRKPDPKDPWDPAKIRRNRVPIRYKQNLYFESLEYPCTKEMEFLLTQSKSGNKKLDANGNIIDVEAREDGAGPGPRKKRLAPGEVDKDAIAREKMLATFRELPRLEGSQIAFFINGESQGTAFENIFDFIPLRKQEDDDKKPRKTKNGVVAPVFSEDGVPEIISATASTSTILKSRMNHFDDGLTGYFPLVSVFGGAQARLNPGPHFKYPPPDNIEDVLNASTSDDVHMSSADQPRNWRPLSDRYEEWVKEQWQYDLEDEVRECHRAEKRRVWQREMEAKVLAAQQAYALKRKAAEDAAAANPVPAKKVGRKKKGFDGIEGDEASRDTSQGADSEASASRLAQGSTSLHVSAADAVSEKLLVDQEGMGAAMPYQLPAQPQEAEIADEMSVDAPADGTLLVPPDQSIHGLAQVPGNDHSAQVPHAPARVNSFNSMPSYLLAQATTNGSVDHVESHPR